MLCAFAGLATDADILFTHARQEAVRHKATHGGQIPCERLVRRICNLKQGYTQHGNLRPFAVHMIYAGYDPENGFQLFSSNADGIYQRWKAEAIGSGAGPARSILENNYTDSCDLTEACVLAVATLLKIETATDAENQGDPSFVDTLPSQTESGQDLKLTTGQSRYPPCLERRRTK
jgi:20S proteasome subunit alpha 3